MGIALLVGALAGAVISLIGIASGILRSNGWTAIIVYGILGLAYAFLVFSEPKATAL